MATNKIDATRFVWEEVTGLKEILGFTEGKTMAYETREVFNRDVATDGHGERVFGNYGSRLDFVEEGMVFTDGSALLCGSVSTWAGTFAEHDNISVRYYALTPRR